MINKIKEISVNIKSSLNSLLKNKEELINKLDIDISELFGNSENLREIKLTLLEKNFDLFYYTLKEDLAKLKIVNQIIDNLETTKFIENLEKFIFNFIEYREIWKIIDWKYYYDIFDNEIHLFSSRKALICRTPIENGYTTSIKNKINELSKNQFDKKLNKLISILTNEVSLIEKTLDFKILIEKLRKNAYNSFADSLKYEWNNLIKINELTQAQLSIMGFIARTAIETSLKNHPMMNNEKTNKKTLGVIFNELHQKGILNDKKEDIKQKLEPLNKLVHNKNNQITKDEIIGIKEYFSLLLSNQNINLPI